MNQVKYGVVLNYCIIALNALVGLLYTPYMLRCLGQNEYGLYSLVASIIAYLTIMDFGFGNAIVRYTSKFLAENKKHEQYEMFGMFTKLYCVIGLLAFLIGLVLYFNVDNLFDRTMSEDDLSQAKSLMAVLLVNLALTFPLSIFGSIINAYENFIFQKLAQIARIALSTIVMIVILKFGYKAMGLVVVQTVFNISFLLANWLYCKYQLNVKIIFGKFNWSFFNEIFVYSFWVFLDAITSQFYWNSGQWVLGIYQGTIMIAIFSLALQLKNMFYLFSSAISSVFLPRVTRMVTLNVPKEEVSDLFIKTGRIQFTIIAYILTGFIIFGKAFINLWVGEDYGQAYYILILIFTCTTIPLIQNLGSSILLAHNKMRRRSLVVVAASFLSLIGAFPCAKYWGAIGCSIPIFISVVIAYGPIINKLYKDIAGINVKKFWHEILGMTIVPIIFIAIGIISMKQLVIANWGLLACYVVIFTILYLPLFYHFSLNIFEKQLFIGVFKKLKLVSK